MAPATRRREAAAVGSDAETSPATTTARSTSRRLRSTVVASGSSLEEEYDHGADTAAADGPAASDTSGIDLANGAVKNGNARVNGAAATSGTSSAGGNAEPEEEGTAASVAAAKLRALKRPPPDTPAAIRMRTLVIASFWLVVLLAGVPIWLWTTSIHRAVLPLREMQKWADGKACTPSFKLDIEFKADHLSDDQLEALLQSTKEKLDSSEQTGNFQLRLRRRSNSPKSALMQQPAVEVALGFDPGQRDIEIISLPHSTRLDIRYGPQHLDSPTAANSDLIARLASRLNDLFAEERTAIDQILTQSRHDHDSSSATSDPLVSARLAQRATRALKYSPNYHISLSLFTPKAVPSAWEIQEAIEQTLDPLIASYPLSNLSVDSQVQLYSTLSPSAPQPVYDEQKQAWTLGSEDLSSFVNAADWPLSPSIGDGPTLNFIVYVPDVETAPLLVRENSACSWLIPQWGGVFILNPIKDVEWPPSTLTATMIEPALLAFGHQLLQLLGATEQPDSFALQVASMRRVHLASLMTSAASTLGSLAQLTKSLSSIPIPENVAAGVDEALTALRAACTALDHSDFETALNHARLADTCAERAFFDKSMVGQVYFPDEHKIAVYLPLLGPIGVPLVTSLRTLRQGLAMFSKS